MVVRRSISPRIATLAAVVGWLGCGTPSADPQPNAETSIHTTAVPSAARLTSARVLFDGCANAGPGPTCELSPRAPSLTVWAGVDEPSQVMLLLDGTPSDMPPPVAAEDGWRWTIEIPPTAHRLQLAARSASLVSSEAPGPVLLDLALTTRERTMPTQLRMVEQAARRDLEAARSYLSREMPQWSGEQRVLALRLAGNLALAANDRVRAEAHYTAAIDLAGDHGLWTFAQQMAQTLAYFCIEVDREFQCGQSWIDRDRSLQPFPTPMHRYYEGLLAERRGNLAQAQRVYGRVLQDMIALDQRTKPDLELALRGRMLMFRARVGDGDGVLAQLEAGRALGSRVDDYLRASFLNTAAWAMLRPGPVASRPRPANTSDSPRALLEQARTLLASRPADDDLRTITELNLAYEALTRSELDAAAPLLETLATRAMPRNDAQWHRLLSARLATAQGRLVDATQTLDTMLSEAQRHGEHNVRWAARVDYGKVLERRGRTDEALQQYARAEQQLEAQLLFVGVDDRERFMVEHDLATRRRVAVLLDRGETNAALCATRLARTRVLRALQLRLRGQARPASQRAFDDYLGTRLRLDKRYDATFWEADVTAAERTREEIRRQRESNEQQLRTVIETLRGDTPAAPGCDALSTPAVDSLDLHFVRLETGWVALAHDSDDRVTVHVLGALEQGPPPGTGEQLRQQWWSDQLLAPLAARLHGVDILRVMPSGILYSVDIHALPFGGPGRLLQDETTVVYGLDLPQTAAAQPSEDRSAFIVQPPSNLPHAESEAQSVAQYLRAAGPTEWLGHTEDDTNETSPLLTQQVLSALPRASWLHYVGHAQANDDRGWDSQFLLAADGSMSVGVSDLFALPSAPTVAILSGCETGVADPQSLSGGMSLAHAFVLAGSQAVVATTHAVRDDEALSLMRDFYASLQAPRASAVPPAMRQAQRRAHTQAAATSKQQTAWRLTRVWVP